MNFKNGSLVIITKQPQNQFVNLTGCLAIIEKVRGKYADIRTIDDHNKTIGMGTVPLDCLKLYSLKSIVKECIG